ncbi:MAG: ribosome silencing factor [Chloroflexota bacterium]
MDIVEERKAEDIVLLDLGPDTIIADYFVICTGGSDRQLRALIQYIRDGVKETANRLPYATEGEPASGWVLMDYGDVVVHLFLEEERRYYDLESFWKSANVLLSIQ